MKEVDARDPMSTRSTVALSPQPALLLGSVFFGLGATPVALGLLMWVLGAVCSAGTVKLLGLPFSGEVFSALQHLLGRRGGPAMVGPCLSIFPSLPLFWLGRDHSQVLCSAPSYSFTSCRWVGLGSALGAS